MRWGGLMKALATGDPSSMGENIKTSGPRTAAPGDEVK
jgi:hypothetical protein